MLESWLLTDLVSFPQIRENNPYFQDNDNYTKILNVGSKIAYSLEYFLNPLNSIGEVRGVKLEDLKNNPSKTLENILSWIGIKNDKSLYESTFMNKKFSRPSVNFNNISGFDTRSITPRLGRVFGKTDIEILETLFWPFMSLYGYSKISKEMFLDNVLKIRPYLELPFKFEIDIYNKLPDDKPHISKIEQFNYLHKSLINIWGILNEFKNYPHLIKPLELK